MNGLPAFLVFVAIAYLLFLHPRVKKAGGLRLLLQGTQSPGELKDGQVAKVEGRVKALETLVAPLSGNSCVCFHLRIEVYKGRGDTKAWKLLHEEQVGSDFLLVGEAHTAMVETSNVELSLKLESQKTTSFDKADPLVVLANARGLDFDQFRRKYALRVSEGVLLDGAQVVVAGEAQWEIDPTGDVTSAGYRDTERAKRVRLKPTSDGPTLISER